MLGPFFILRVSQNYTVVCMLTNGKRMENVIKIFFVFLAQSGVKMINFEDEKCRNSLSRRLKGFCIGLLFGFGGGNEGLANIRTPNENSCWNSHRKQITFDTAVMCFQMGSVPVSTRGGCWSDVGSAEDPLLRFWSKAFVFKWLLMEKRTADRGGKGHQSI